MGPRPFSRGNHPLRSPGAARSRRRFNGATTFQPWKHEAPGGCRSEVLSFNGATTFQPWKLRIRDVNSDIRVRFNGATTFQPWKPRTYNSGNNRTVWLQWGHDLSAVETTQKAPWWKERHPASMGPRPFSRGNKATIPSPESGQAGFNGATTFQPWKHGIVATPDRLFIVLQWGHDLSAVETPSAPSSPPQNSGLQWGHDLSAVETTIFPLTREDVALASMGPRPFSRGNGSPGRNPRTILTRFNGATTFQPWKQDCPTDCPPFAPRLQWGHDLSAVETLRCGAVSEGVLGFNGATTFQPWKLRL